MRKLLLLTIILLFFAAIPLTNHKAKVEASDDCTTAEIISVAATAAADAICANDSGPACSAARSKAIHAQIQFLAACY